MATKKRAPKRSTAHPKRARKTVPVSHRSFRIQPEVVPFYTFQFTRQTVYWLILLVVIAILQLWIVKLQVDISNLSDTITVLQGGK